MSQHVLQGREPAEILWYQRRSFLRAAAAWSTLGGWAGAQAQSRGNIVELQGPALLNGRTLRPDDTIQTGDTVQTGPGTILIFVIGNTAFHVRQNTQMEVRRGDTLNAVSVLRLITGAVVSVWGRGNLRQIVTPTLTAGIRGTGVYTEVHPELDNRTYFCNCYGVVELATEASEVLSSSEYHDAWWAWPTSAPGPSLRPAQGVNHTDAELEALARLVGQRTAWQITGRKSQKPHAAPGSY